MYNNDFFNFLRLLRQTHHKPTAFNLFKVLKNSSDEVGLHSRFLTAMLDPNGSHQGGSQYLSLWIEELGLSDFKLNDIEVFAEYKHIDILIRNNNKQAIVIENKIYAADQPAQLTRYYETMVDEGIEDIYVVYLTLHGHKPSDDSIKGLDESFVDSDHFHLMSYELEIHRWLSKCIQVDALNAALRESLAQYQNLIEQLTGTEQSESYMTELKKLLRTGDNFANFLDLQHAYNETLVDLQWKLWHEMLDHQRKAYPKMGEYDSDSIFNTGGRDEVAKFYYRQRNNRYYGIYYPFSHYRESIRGGIGIEIYDQIYIGIHCNKEQRGNAKIHKKFEQLFRSKYGGNSTQWWPVWRYIKQSLNFKNVDREVLGILADDEKRIALAQSIVDEAYKIWKDVICEINKGAFD